MVIGDPFKFAIIIEVIKAWNPGDYKGFANGVLFFCVDGEIFPNFVVNATLGYELHNENFIDKLANPAVNAELYHMEKEKSFSEMYSITYPHYSSSAENDHRYNITPQEFSDKNCLVFAVSNGEQVRIMASGSTEISEVFLPINELNDIVSELKIFRQTTFD